MRGEVLLALGRADEARKVLERCVELDPDKPRAHFQLATSRQLQGNVEGAIEAYGRELALNDDPRIKIMAHLNRSLLFEQQKELLAAASEIEAVLVLDPGRIEAYGDLATLYLAANRPEEAGRQLSLGLEAGYRSAPHMYGLGARYFKDKSYEKAGEAFASALEIDPGHAEACRSLAMTLDELGRKSEAEQHFRRYLELRPDADDADKINARIAATAGS
jgi:tetratricopeptide (TPR) repeat protein